VGGRSHLRPIRTRSGTPRGGDHHRSSHAATTDDLVPGDQLATPWRTARRCGAVRSSRPDGSCATVRAQELGGARRQAPEAGARLGSLHGSLRSGDSPTLAARLVRLLLLLAVVVRGHRPPRSHPAAVQRSGHRTSHHLWLHISAGAGGTWRLRELARRTRSPGHRRSVAFAAGWIPGWTSGAAGTVGRTRPRLLNCWRSSTPSPSATRSTSIAVANKLPVVPFLAND
jgi:hypothetical protein